MSQAIDALSTPSACMPSPHQIAFPDAPLFDLRARWESVRADRAGLPDGADAAPLAPEEGRMIEQILALPAQTLAGVGAKIEAAVALAGAAAPERLRQVIEEGAPVLERVFSAVPGFAKITPMVAVMARILAEAASPEAPAQGNDAAPPDGRTVPSRGEPIEIEVLYRALCGWVAVLAALQLSVEHNMLPPAAFDPVLTEMVQWRRLAGAALSAKERGANF